jgi:hypothetical protein
LLTAMVERECRCGLGFYPKPGDHSLWSGVFTDACRGFIIILFSLKNLPRVPAR